MTVREICRLDKHVTTTNFKGEILKLRCFLTVFLVAVWKRLKTLTSGWVYFSCCRTAVGLLKQGSKVQLNFQFKFLHRRVATNTFLTKTGIKNAELCTFCRNESESLLDLFWSCTITTKFWTELKKLLFYQGLFAPTRTICVRLKLGLNT